MRKGRDCRKTLLEEVTFLPHQLTTSTSPPPWIRGLAEAQMFVFKGACKAAAGVQVAG